MKNYLLFWSPFHLHIQSPAFKFIQHLFQPFLPGFFSFGVCDPADVIVALIGGSRMVGIHQATGGICNSCKLTLVSNYRECRIG